MKPSGRWRRERNAAVRDLARETGVDADKVARIFDGMAREIRKGADNDEDIIRVMLDATQQLKQIAIESNPVDEDKLQQLLGAVSEPHFTILRHYRAGMKHPEIAELLQLDKQTVLRSLTKTYADLRMKMIGVGEIGETGS